MTSTLLWRSRFDRLERAVGAPLKRFVPVPGVRAGCPGGNDTPGTSAFASASASAKSLAGTPACAPGSRGCAGYGAGSTMAGSR